MDKTYKASDGEAPNLRKPLHGSYNMLNLQIIQTQFANYALGASGACLSER